MLFIMKKMNQYSRNSSQYAQGNLLNTMDNVAIDEKEVNINYFTMAQGKEALDKSQLKIKILEEFPEYLK